MAEPAAPKPQATNKPQATQAKQASKPQGIGALLRGKPRPAQLQKPTAEMVEAIKKPPTLATEIAPQPFYGDPPQREEPVASAPFIQPIPIRMPIPPAAATTLRFAAAPKKKAKRADFTRPDFKQKDREIAEQDDFDDLLPQEFLDYQAKQAAIEDTDPYLTNTLIYTPQSRKSFYRFINKNYGDVFRLLPQVKGRIDEEACAKLEQKAGAAVESFLYQKFVREYIRNAAPYRGMLVYHGLGSGKTCSAIAAAEALYGTSNKKIIVMTPFSLRGNFMSEISFCGFRHFSLTNHWVELSLDLDVTNENEAEQLQIILAYGRSVLSLTDTYLRRVRQRQPSSRRVLWVPDFTKPPNDTSLTPQQRDDIREQITTTIESRITFISYNGITASKLKEYACTVDPVTGNRFFDDAVIVIDEIHNLTRLMQGEVTPYITSRKGRKRKVAAEPIVPGKWVPSLCNKPMNYKRAYLFYRLLTDARQSKIIGLSGTPIINFPEELGILANVLAGYTECVEFTLRTSDPATIKRVREIAEVEERVDIVRFRAANQQMSVLISVFPEGYTRVMDEATDKFVGVQFDEDATDGIQKVYEAIKANLLKEKIPIGEETFVSYPRLPIDGEEFRQEFIHPTNLSIQNRVVLQKRLTGLISYYKGSKEEYMPRVVRDEVVECEMSDYTLSMYTVARNIEIKGEMQKEEKGDAYAAVEMFAKMKNPSSYRFRSRALCNFAFPKAIDRPFPSTKEEEVEAEAEAAAIAEDVEVSEVVADLGIEEAEKAAQEAVAAEEAQIEAAEEAEEAAVPAEAAEPLKTGGDLEVEQEGGADDRPPPPPSLRARPRVPSAVPSVAAVPADVAPSAPAPSVADEAVVPAPSVAAEVAVPADVAPSVPTEAAVAAVPKRPRPIPVRAASIVQPAPENPPESVKAPPPPSKRPRPAIASQMDRPNPRAPVPATAADTQVEPAQAAAEAAPAAQAFRTIPYTERVARAMARLDADRALYMNLDDPQPEKCLRHYSMKLDQLLRRIQSSKGSNLVYSQFKTVEGLGVLGVALRANGYDEIQIMGSDAAPQFTPATIASFEKGPEARVKRFITFTGEGSKDRRNLILNIFNGNLDKLPEGMRSVLEPYAARRNQYGDICWVIGITGAGAEGISLKCCRSVHVVESFWNQVRLEQVKGRAVRICSHKDLPYAEREVEIYTYCTVFSEEQKKSSKIDMHIKLRDEGETSDQKVYSVSKKKEIVSKALLEVMQEAAVDCGLNAADNDGVQCFVVDGRPDQYMFDPSLEVDKIQTSMELKEVPAAKPQPSKAQAADQVEAKERPKATMLKIPVIRARGEEFMLREKPNTGGAIMQLFTMRDTEFRSPKGEVAVDPMTGAYSRLRMY